MARFRKNFGGDEELEKRYYDALERAKKYAKLIKEGKLMSNQPVAYVNNMCNDSIDWKVEPMDLEEGTPLYTHPIKELTDEEIHNLFLSFCNVGFTQVDEIGFAKAILRKAQEK